MNEAKVLDLLEDPNTPRDVIMQILNAVNKIAPSHIGLRTLVYSNPKNVKLSLKISKGIKKSMIIEKCVLHPNFDVSVWKEFLKSYSYKRGIVALFKRTDLPKEAFEMGVNMNKSVRREIALNPSCPEHILRQLSLEVKTKLYNL